jgi:hypothetical protein
VTVAAPARRHPYAIQVRAPQPEPTFVQIASPMPISSLDRARLILADDHADHVNGPVFPCPQCFLPPHTQGR